MSIKIIGLDQVLSRLTETENKFTKELKAPMRKALNAGARELKSTVKPLVPQLSSSTNFRQKGTIKNNIRHKTVIAKDGLSGYSVVKVMRPKGQRMAKIGENTRDKRDPFYWWMVEYGTVKMKGRHYMEKGFKSGEAQALKIAKEVAEEELKKAFK